MQNGDILVLANLGSPGEIVDKMEMESNYQYLSPEISSVDDDKPYDNYISN